MVSFQEFNYFHEGSANLEAWQLDCPYYREFSSQEK